jgi:hypothetical protein
LFWAVLEHAPIEPDEVARSYFVEGRVIASAEQCPGSCTILGGHVVSATLVPDRE